jgi:hypothetical protein
MPISFAVDSITLDDLATILLKPRHDISDTYSDFAWQELAVTACICVGNILDLVQNVRSEVQWERKCDQRKRCGIIPRSGILPLRRTMGPV